MRWKDRHNYGEGEEDEVNWMRRMRRDRFFRKCKKRSGEEEVRKMRRIKRMRRDQFFRKCKKRSDEEEVRRMRRIRRMRMRKDRFSLRFNPWPVHSKKNKPNRPTVACFVTTKLHNFILHNFIPHNFIL